MATTTNAVLCAQLPKAAFARVTAANTSLDGSGTITPLLTAGADGCLVTSLQARCQATVTATALRLWVSLDGGASWALWDEKLMVAYTVAQITAQNAVTFVDKVAPDTALRLPANAKLGVTSAVALSGGIVFVAEFMDF